MASTRAFEMLREIVRDCGAQLEGENLDAKKTNALQAEFKGRSNIRFRLNWDQKAKRGILQVQGPDNTWTDEGPEVVKDRNVHYTNLRGFMQTAERLSGRGLGDD